MRLPTLSSSSQTHLRFAIFAAANLRAHSQSDFIAVDKRQKLGALADDLQIHIDSLYKENQETEKQVLFVQPHAQAKQNAALMVLSMLLTEASSTVTALVAKGNKRDPLLKEFLPDGIGGIKNAALDDRPELVLQATHRLKQLPDFTDKALLVERLEKAVESAKAAILQNDAADVAWSQERSEEMVAKGKLRLKLEEVHGALKSIFAGQKALVESFFYIQDRPSESPASTDAGDVPVVE